MLARARIPPGATVIARKQLLLPLFVSALLSAGCATTRVAATGPKLADSDRDQLTAALEAYLSEPDAWSRPRAATVAAVIASVNPDRAFALIERGGLLKDETPAELREGVLFEVLNAIPAAARAKKLAELGDKVSTELQVMLEVSEPRPSVEKIAQGLPKLKTGSPSDPMLPAMIALKVQACGVDGWEKLRPTEMAADSDPLIASIVSFLDAMLDQKPAAMVPFFAQRTAEDSFLRFRLLDGIFVLLGPDGPRPHAARLLEAARTAGPQERFLMAAVALPRLSAADAAKARAMVAETWDPKILPATFGIEHAAVFYAMQGLLEEKPDLARTMYRALCDNILSWDPQEAGLYYHAIGTASGVIARIDPALAFEQIKRIHSLEWSVHAERCVYRTWGRTHPAEALAAKKDFDDVDKERIFQDLQLETIIGAGMADSSKALTALQALPDHEDRFEQGTSVVATSLSRTDPHAAIALLLRPDKKLPPLSALAGAWILAGDSRERIFSTRLPEFADWAMPQQEWPGPELSMSLRFAPPQAESPSSDVPLVEPEGVDSDETETLPDAETLPEPTSSKNP
jgi:hypothetical protein